MKKLLTILSITIGGWIGWWIGGHIGIMSAYFLSVFGAAAGIYFGRKLMSGYME